MKAKVIRVFKDKNTGVLHEIGKTIEVTKGRYGEINSTAYGIFLEEIEEEKPEKKKK